MRCDDCQEREAQFNLTSIEEGEMRTLNLCQECADARGLGMSVPEKAPLADFLAQMATEEGSEESPSTEEPCPYCGTTYADFRRSGRLGCAQCYGRFEAQLRPLLRRLHGATQHVGKLYQGETTETGDRFARLASMRVRLQRAVDVEDFESAATLRDLIHELELEGAG
ncbi:MAG: UvrB/UvrC motif-containing protein [Gemmatimonadota bacterium]